MPFIDLHCDTIARLLACQRAGHPAHLRRGEPLHVNLEKLRRSGYLLQAFALFVNLHGTPAPAGDGGGGGQDGDERLTGPLRKRCVHIVSFPAGAALKTGR